VANFVIFRLDNFKPALGKIFSSACHSKLFLERVQSKECQDSFDKPVLCKLTVVKSDVMTSGSHCLLKLTKKGFENY
jgi:hypothetical protein